MRGILSFLIAAGFLILTACAGGGSSDSAGGNGGSGDPNSLEVDLTFAPIANGFVISNQSDFGDMVSLNITATSGSEVEEQNINIDEFIDKGYYNFTGLGDQSDWRFQIIGTLSDGGEQEVKIVFVWEENKADHRSGGIRPGANRDGDGRADSVDDDIDGDGIDNEGDDCSAGETSWMSNPSTDNDGDGCRDDGEDRDDDNDGVGDDSDQCRVGETGWTSNPSTDNDMDGCRDAGEDMDDDNDNSTDGADIDDDGDGLIEIRTAAELDAVRHALRGDGRRLLEGGELNTTGCGDGNTTTSCAGYELVANISLAAYSQGEGWQPLGHDTDTSKDRCQGAPFKTTFEGNGWTISDLNISRSAEDCLGLFGHITTDATIRNLTLYAESVIGRNRVGGLVGFNFNGSIVASFVVVNNMGGNDQVGGLAGWSNSTRIIYSSVVVGEVSGNNAVGGLVGDGQLTRIFSSSAVVGEVSGNDNVGGLVGGGQLTRIFSSSAVVGEVSGNDNVGGLVGGGIEVGVAQIVSSSVVVGEVSGTGQYVGGLVGDGKTSARIFSSSVVVGEVSGNTNVGGLAGRLGSDSRIVYSYVVSGSNTAMLVGDGSGTGKSSYWDSETSDVTSGNYGQAKTTSDLQTPTDYTGTIYDTWDDQDVDGNNEPLAVWCDRDNSGTIETAEQNSDNLIWDFGTSSEYPAIRCTPLAPDEWRDWWSLEGMPAKPQLNQTRLDDLLPSLD